MSTSISRRRLHLGCRLRKGRTCPGFFLPISRRSWLPAFKPPLPGQSVFHVPSRTCFRKMLVTDRIGWLGSGGEMNFLGSLWWVSALSSAQGPWGASSWDHWSNRTAVPGCRLAPGLQGKDMGTFYSKGRAEAPSAMPGYSWRDESKGKADCCHIFTVIAFLYPCGAYHNFSLFVSVLSSSVVFEKFILAKFFVLLLRATLSLSDEQGSSSRSENRDVTLMTVTFILPKGRLKSCFDARFVFRRKSYWNVDFFAAKKCYFVLLHCVDF